MSERDTDEHNAGLFARKQLSIIDRVFLTGGIRFDTFKRIQENPVTGERAERTDSAFSPNLGWSSAILKTSSHRVNVFGGWGRGFSPVFRAVNNTQFADVKPETSESFEVGVKAELYGRLAEVTATAYQLDRKDIVAMNPATKLQENVGDWRIQGVETDLRLRPARNVLVYGALAARNPRIHKYLAESALEGNKIPAISSRMLTAGATYKTPFGLGAGTEVRVVSSFFGNEQNSFQLPAYTLWDAWIHYDHEDSYRIAFYVKNILNTDYYTAVFSGVKNGSAFVGQPQSYGATFSARF
jgi:iron complex outermembrane receptor protein